MRILLLILYFYIAYPHSSHAIDVYKFSSIKKKDLALSIAKDLRCPKCKNQNILDSDSLIAKDLRIKVYNLVEEGRGRAYIFGYMKKRYGDFVLYQPSFYGSGLLRIIPFLFFICICLSFFVYLRRSKK